MARAEVVSHPNGSVRRGVVLGARGEVVSTPESAYAREMERIWRAGSRDRQRFYRGGKDDRIKGTWPGATKSADAELLPVRQRMIYRSRQLDQDDPIARGVFDTRVNNVIGSGIKSYADVDGAALGLSDGRAAELNEVIDEYWRLWVQECDYAGNAASGSNFYELQEQTELAQLRDGEEWMFHRYLERPGALFRYCVQFVEQDRIGDPSGSDARGKDIRDGIQIGERGEEQGVWVANRHPNDYGYGRTSRGVTYAFVPAVNATGLANYQHLFTKRLRGQTHGEPWFAPVLDYFRRLDDEMMSEFIGGQVARMFSLFIKTPYPQGAAKEMQSSRFESLNKAGLFAPVEEIGFGQVRYLYPDEDIVHASPQIPTDNFDKFIRSALLFIGAALGFPIELVLKDFSQSNFSNVRAALIEARRFFSRRQLWHGAKLIEPCRYRVIEEMWLRGWLPRWAPDFRGNERAYTRYELLPPGWDWIDPKADAVAAASALSTGTTTWTDIWGGKGQRPKRKMRQYVNELAELQKAAADAGAVLPVTLLAPPKPEPEERSEGGNDGR